MKALAINGSPRKGGNTATLLSKALEGATGAGAETKLVHLRDLDFTGCSSCFACKRKGSTLAGHCAMRDDLTGILERALTCNVLLLGSPIYLGALTGSMKCFLERLVFPNLSYDVPDRICFQGEIATGFVYAMGMPHNLVEQSGYNALFETNKSYLQLLSGPSEYVVSADNYQFTHYENYAASNFDEQHKLAVRTELFPQECQNAFEMGARLCAQHTTA